MKYIDIEKPLKIVEFSERMMKFHFLESDKYAWGQSENIAILENINILMTFIWQSNPITYVEVLSFCLQI